MHRLTASIAVLTSALVCHGPARAAEVIVTKAYAACKDPATVEKFEEFERNDNDQGYKRLYFETGATRECIFLRSNEILSVGETRGRWICIKESERASCYWTAQEAVRPR
ncbi:hypothetical protein ACVIJ6_000032 [Bradyrhizobium sp. USDA 4369]|jgi:hypothetical protein|uniref:hypothetical protein n=1 Tax=Bradyrhizobium sp. TaxID=376 RepID=UPI0018063699|nr:hypothetical protein [Bradyrhizobium sp.]